MTRVFSLLLLIYAATGLINARTFVLATGVSNYGDPWSNLTQTTKDAKRFKALFETQTKDITLLTSKNVTRENVLAKLRAISNRARKGDRVIFFYSGHGMPGAICGYDMPIAYDDIIDVLSGSDASEKICFIDACYAGSINEKNSSKGWQKSIKGTKDQAFFVSCRGDEYSVENPIIGAGYFTQALLKGLRGKSDIDKNKEVTVIELFKYIYKDVLRRSKESQHPQLIAPESMYDIVLMKW